ncbi:uncharacterized protein LOC126814967 isoform X2 [Patella vulgata]|nr:uncharacterized protein LOC126814967 isoform X2 [Patella vulgata]
MGIWEKYTCLRYVPYNSTTSSLYGIGHESHLHFFNDPQQVCQSPIGRMENKTRRVRCCALTTCLHELGHAAGLLHEQKSSERDDWVRINWENIKKELWYAFGKLPSDETTSYGYDISSRMHYSSTAFTTEYGETITSLFDEVSMVAGEHYTFREASIAHNCQAMFCPGRRITCENGGYFTLVKGVCSCKCVDGLNPDTGCRTVLQAKATVEFPKGHYTILMAKEGCPHHLFQTGRLTHRGEGDNSVGHGGPQGLAGDFSTNSFTYRFCTSDNQYKHGGDWPKGNYCILRRGGTCPLGFISGGGHIQFGDTDWNPAYGSRYYGTLPDGVYDDNTKLEFCCREDGAIIEPIDLPAVAPLVLFLYKQNIFDPPSCQAVKGMQYRQEHITFDNEDGGIFEISGTTPYTVTNANERISMYYCVYQPVDRYCGGVISLTHSNEQASIHSPNYPHNYENNKECFWLITGPPKSNILVNVNDISIEKSESSNECIDTLEVRYILVGQRTAPICGKLRPTTIRSVYNTVLIRFSTSMQTVDRGFKLNLKLALADDHCYDVDNKGKYYRGSVNYTRTYKPCLPWTQVTHCRHHSFNYDDVNDGLDGNYCRNPGHGVRPWCYYEATECARDYCDACGLEDNVNKISDCDELIASNPQFCTTDYGFENCHRSCGFPVQQPEMKERDMICNILPNDPIDGYPLPTVGPYYVGDTVAQRCGTLAHDVIIRVCLGNGKWTPARFACGVCVDGWTVYDGGCYKFYNQKLKWNEANATCYQDDGAVIAPARNAEEMAFLNRFSGVVNHLWIGAHNKSSTHTTYVWSDGLPVTSTNWLTGRPDNRYNSENCVVMLSPSLKWEDLYCGHYYKNYFVCMKNRTVRVTCIDQIDNCLTKLQENPKMCSISIGYSETVCPFTCGVCELGLPNVYCSLPEPSAHSATVLNYSPWLSRGEFVSYKCVDGYVLSDGNLDRACQPDGTLTGSPPTCIEKSYSKTFSNDVIIKHRSKIIRGSQVLLSLNSNLYITRSGRITQWHFFAAEGKSHMFQVWRPMDATGTTFELIGFNEITPTETRMYIFNIDTSQQIVVTPGDIIGIWSSMGSIDAGITYDICQANLHPQGSDMLRTSRMFYYNTDFNIGMTTSVVDYSPSCMMISVKAYIEPI